MVDFPTNQVAFHNEGVQQLFRLHDLYQICNRCSSSGQLARWKWTLDALWRELSPGAFRLDMVIKEEKDKWYSKKKEIDTRIIAATDPIKLYPLLCEKEEFIRLLQDKCGKGTRWRDEDDDDFD